ncbi:hypothetical protein [Prevotella fusca]|jgi:hypothetical protein|uniref:TerD domain-containing protein n=1 Tax=Prevotella fusca JCM 17724 TaxID=1236517 RepID=A0A0K1NMT8_9BACT|nr:hypothetical protein [Prevotella fusca]AKU70394.1 hypothetical protein ADJ77_11560 [Prevotella fusca JCM 17724]QUB86027.1 hypothetical protein J5A51_01815 [Prevotella fusca JCM 17724]
MAEVTLKRKITLRRKQEECAFTFSGKLKVKLFWTSDTDLDLCLFFKKKNGEVGGVFSNEYRGKRSDLGALDKFPFMLHLGDNKEPAEGNEETEQINIASLDEIEQAFVCIVNYKAAIDQLDVTYAEEGGRVELQSDSGDYLEVLADSTDEGHVYCVCSIKNNEGEYALKNESRVMDLGTAFDEIPGFSIICN